MWNKLEMLFAAISRHLTNTANWKLTSSCNSTVISSSSTICSASVISTEMRTKKGWAVWQRPAKFTELFARPKQKITTIIERTKTRRLLFDIYMKEALTTNKYKKVTLWLCSILPKPTRRLISRIRQPNIVEWLFNASTPQINSSWRISAWI